MIALTFVPIAIRRTQRPDPPGAEWIGVYPDSLAATAGINHRIATGRRGGKSFIAGKSEK